MPWSNQGGGGGGGGRKGGGGPWGQGPWGQGGGGNGGGGGGNQPPDLDEILRRGQDRVKQVIRGGGGRGGGGSGEGGGVPRPFMFLIAVLALMGIAFYGFFFRVNPDEQGIVLRFGKFDRWQGPGLHFRMPYPIEEVRTPQVTQQRTIEVGTGPGGSTECRMSLSPFSPAGGISPCVNICQMDEISGLCRGCFRTLDEIHSWRRSAVGDKLAIPSAVHRRGA